MLQHEGLNSRKLLLSGVCQFDKGGFMMAAIGLGKKVAMAALGLSTGAGAGKSLQHV